MSVKGFLCASSDYEIVGSSDECEKAANQLSKGNHEVVFKVLSSDTSHPKGCFVYTGTPGRWSVYFNPDAIGSKNEHVQQICKKQSTKKNTLIFEIFSRTFYL